MMTQKFIIIWYVYIIPIVSKLYIYLYFIWIDTTIYKLVKICAHA